MIVTGRYNGLTDINGLMVGNYTDRNALSGVTVILCLPGAIAGVDVRGSAPGTRETDLLSSTNLVEKVQAVVLSGGSVFGLSAADGVVRWLAEHGFGFPLDDSHVAPIVPAATLFDLGRGPRYVPPVNAKWGITACRSATDGPFAMGCVGAGTGALSGNIKGGLGTASIIMESGITVAAIVAVNSYGSVVDPDSGKPWEIGLEVGMEFGDLAQKVVILPASVVSSPNTNTTIGVVATDATLTKPQARKVAQMAHDGMARAVRPCHTMFDGDTIFCLATGKKEIPETPGLFLASDAQTINDIGHAAADCMSRAIINGIFKAESFAGMIAFCDLVDR